MTTTETRAPSEGEVHHLVGSGIEPGGVPKGCAHSDSELRDYINFGTLPNPDCPRIKDWNRQ